MILCRNGHPNPDGTTYCQVCKTYIDLSSQPVVTEETEETEVKPVAAPPLVSLSPTTVTLAAGEEGGCDVGVQNAGEVADEYSLEVTGPAAQWAVVVPDALVLAPGALQVVHVTFRPDAPDAPTSLPFEVTVSSAQLPDPPVSAQGVLELLAPTPTETRTSPPPRPAIRPAVGTAIAGAVLLAAGVILVHPDGHSFLMNDFGGTAKGGGLYTSLSPIAVVVGALAAARLVAKDSTRLLGAGLLLGFGIAASTKYLAVAGSALSDGSAGRWLPVLAGCALLAVAAVLAQRSVPATATAPAQLGLAVAALAAAGGVLVLAGTILPFSHGGGPRISGDQAVVNRGWGAVEPILSAVAMAGLGFAVFRTGRRRVLWLGALVAVGVVTALLWVRYIGVPVLRGDDLGSGAFVGLAGSALAVLAGWLGYVTRADPADEAAFGPRQPP